MKGEKGHEGIRVGNGGGKEWEAVLLGLLEWFTRFQVGASAVVPAILLFGLLDWTKSGWLVSID